MTTNVDGLRLVDGGDMTDTAWAGDVVWSCGVVDLCLLMNGLDDCRLYVSLGVAAATRFPCFRCAACGVLASLCVLLAMHVGCSVLRVRVASASCCAVMRTRFRDVQPVCSHVLLLLLLLLWVF